MLQIRSVAVPGGVDSFLIKHLVLHCFVLFVARKQCQMIYPNRKPVRGGWHADHRAGVHASAD